MGWKIVERRLGKAGPLKRRLARQREWDRKYGDNWEVGYVVDGTFITQEQAPETVYQRRYELHFQEHPADLEELSRTAKILRYPHAKVTTSVDLQVPAIMEYLKRNGLILRGKDMMDIGSWEGHASHALGIRLSLLSIRVVGTPKMTLVPFWQDKQCLTVWEH